MGFSGWPTEAVEFFQGLRADNTKAYWTAHKTVYEASVREPMAGLLGELSGEFGPGRIARPYRDVRFRADKSPYKTEIYAILDRGGYVKFSADGLTAGLGYFMMTAAQLERYRRAVDERMLALLESADDRILANFISVLELGLNHEEQHQELLLTDLKHAFGLNPLCPHYASPGEGIQAAMTPIEWEFHPAGVRWVGHNGAGFAFDNERPRNRVFISTFAFASRPVNNGEYLQFIEDHGYDRPQLWLSDGWAARQRGGWAMPLYWHRDGNGWSVFTLRGMRSLDSGEPVCHVSYYEADAYARWAGARLPTEFEWETVAALKVLRGNFLDSGRFHTTNSGNSFFGDVWTWTASPYIAYPRFRPAAGAVGEYNGKFMSNQMVLRGGAAVTPPGHIRATYRNFFPPAARWAFSGLRLAEDR